jgi:hypothetical protein
MYNKKIALFMIFLGISGISVHSMENDITKISDLSLNIAFRGEQVSYYPFMATQKNIFRSKLDELKMKTAGVILTKQPVNAASLNDILGVINDCEDILGGFLGADPSLIIPDYAFQSVRELLAELEELRTIIEAKKNNL